MSAAVLDWELLTAPLDPGFDVILCADLMYMADAAGQLAKLIPLLCDAKPGKGSQQALLLMADPEIRTPAHR